MAHGGEWVPFSRAWQITARCSVLYFISVHLILAPFIMPTNAYSMKPLISEPTKNAISSIPADEEMAQQDLIVVNTPNYMYFVSPLRITRMVEGKPLPNRLRALSEGPTPVEITRLDERTLSVIMDDGLFSAPMGRVLRSGKDPFHVGQEVHLTGMTARVAGLNDDGDPRNIVYTFSVPLEDSSLIWVRWEKDTYVTFIPPAVGRSIMLSRAFSPVPFNIFRK
jgi:hypothetical protein